MKHLFLFLLLLPGLLHAQVDPKYMEGAVPLEDGKVVFTKTADISGMTRQAAFDKILAWANGRFVTEGEFQSRVLFSDPVTGQIACLGQQYLVFADKALALDRAVVTYQMTVTCASGKCEMKVSAIRYLYTIGDKRETIPAEEQITDEYTLTKKKDKLIKATGKFRIHTIDLVDELFAGITKTLGSALAPQAAAQPAPVEKAAPAQPAPSRPVAEAAPLTGYKQIAPDKIPGNIYKMLSEDWMLITAGDDKGFNMMTAGWGGLGHLYNKPVAFCFIAPTRHTIKYMENSDTYTLSFYTETYRDALNYCGSHSGKDTDKVAGSGLTPITTPTGSKAFSEAWLIIECKKMVAQTIMPDAISNPEAKEKWGSGLHKMFVGEIINVWVK